MLTCSKDMLNACRTCLRSFVVRPAELGKLPWAFGAFMKTRGNLTQRLQRAARQWLVFSLLSLDAEMKCTHQIGGEPLLNIDSPTVDGKAQTGTMQKVARTPLQISLVGASRGISAVTNDGMANMRRVHPYLMLPPGGDAHEKQAQDLRRHQERCRQPHPCRGRTTKPWTVAPTAARQCVRDCLYVRSQGQEGITVSSTDPSAVQAGDRLIVLLVVRPSLTQCTAARTWLRPRSHPWQRTW